MRTAYSVLCLAIAIMVLGRAAAAETPAVKTAPPKDPARESVTITVYNGDLAVVKDVRRLVIDKENATVSLRDVPARINPTTVHFKSLTDPEGTRILEQNFQYDIVEADALLEKYIDRELAVLTQGGERYKGILLSYDDEQLIVQGQDALYMIARYDNVRNIEFGTLPEGLITRPTLVWNVVTKKPGEHLAQVAYQTGGISWQADYSVVLNADETRMDLSGWVTLTNECGAEFKDSRLKLMGGDVRQVEEGRFELGAAGGGAFGELEERKGFEEKSFFEYHLYTLERPTTIRNHEVKQIELLSASDAPVKKRYLFEPESRYAREREDGTYNVMVVVEFKNDKASNLGMPLPAGIVRMYKRDAADGDLEFIGEDEINHTPRDEVVRLYVGDAFDIVGEWSITDMDEGERWEKQTVQITLRNHKDEDITVVAREQLKNHSWEVTQTSQEFRKVDADTIEFDVAVPKNGEAQVTYKIHYHW